MADAIESKPSSISLTPVNPVRGMMLGGVHGGSHAMMMQNMMQAMMGQDMGMVCVTPAPSADGMGMPGSFACFPQMPRQQMGQFGTGSYGQNRFGWDQRGSHPYGNSTGFNQYGQNMGRYGYGSPNDQSYDPGPSSPNWYYENRQRQLTRGNQDYDRDRNGNYNNYDASRYGRPNSYDDTTGSMSRPGDSGSDYQSYDGSSQPDYNDQQNN